MSHRILTKEEVRNVIAGKASAYRIPAHMNFWLHHWEYPEDQIPRIVRLMARYPTDIQTVSLNMPGMNQPPPDDPEYCWLPESGRSRTNRADLGSVAYDARIMLPDWDILDDLVKAFPSADYPGLIPRYIQPDGRYLLAHWWFCLFERHWELRGMENALTDYYLYPDKVHRLFRTLTDFYKGVIVKAGQNLAADGILTSDDLGTQTGPFFSPEIFRTFFAPYYRELIETAHQHGMQFWLHACGNMTPFMADLIDLGVDIIHPVQKYAMDETMIGRTYGDQISFWAGFDVQRIIPWGSEQEVRDEVRHLLQTYQKPNGRLIFSLGNGVNGECRPELLEALYEEVFAWRNPLL